MAYIEISNKKLIEAVADELLESGDDKFLLDLLRLITMTLKKWEEEIDYGVLMKLSRVIATKITNN